MRSSRPAHQLVQIVALAAVLLAATAPAAYAVDFFVYAVKLKLTAEMVEIGLAEDKIVKMKLGNKEIINLALGRPMKTKVDKKTEVLAGAGTYASDASESMLLVFDPSQNGVAAITTVVGTIDTLDFSKAFLKSKSQGAGFGSGTLAATTLGDPANNGFLESTFFGGGIGSGSHDPFGGDSKVKGKGTASGRLKLNFTDKNGAMQSFDGFVVKSSGKVSGKPIGGFSQ